MCNKLNDKSSLCDSFKINGKMETNPLHISTEFNKYFTTIGKNMADSIPRSDYSIEYWMKNKCAKKYILGPNRSS